MTKPWSDSRRSALKMLGGYLVFATLLASWSVLRGSDSTAWGGPPIALAAYAVLLICTTWVLRSDSRFARIFGDWLPLLALPVLYGAIPGTALGLGPFDQMVQGWDRLIFRTEPARTFAGAMPWISLSEILHAAYLSYYVIIYGPPLMMYVRGDTEAFGRTVHAFVIAMAICFTVFCLFPVQGPRYLWPPPPGIPDGIFRRAVTSVLERGSSRGTAFPSSHQAIALAMSLSSLAWDRRLGIAVLGLTLLLGAGAVYGGLHYGGDMLAGAVVGILSWLVAGRRKVATA